MRLSNDPQPGRTCWKLYERPPFRGLTVVLGHLPRPTSAWLPSAVERSLEMQRRYAPMLCSSFSSAHRLTCHGFCFLAGLRGKLPGDINLPPSVTVPFGSFEETLKQKENADLVKRLDAAIAAIPPTNAEPQLQICRDICMEVCPTRDLHVLMSVILVSFSSHRLDWQICRDICNGVGVQCCIFASSCTYLYAGFPTSQIGHEQSGCSLYCGMGQAQAWYR